MANKKNYNYRQYAGNQNAKTQSTGKKWTAFWAGFIAFIIVVSAILGVMGWRTSGFKDWTFGFSDKVQTLPDTEKPGADGGMIVTPDEGKENGEGKTPSKAIVTMSARVKSAASDSISAQSETSYTITATVTPEESEVTDFTYSIYWANASSSWASGKSVAEYVTLTQSSTNKREATVTNLKAFGEQIIVKCTYDFDVGISGTCTLDYVKRIESIEVVGFDSTQFGFGSSMTVSLTPRYGTGTVTGTVTMTSAHANFNSPAYSYIQNNRFYKSFEQKTEDYLRFQRDTTFKSSLDCFNPATGVISNFMVDEFIDKIVTGTNTDNLYLQNFSYLFAALHELAQKSGQTAVLALDVNYSYSYGSSFTSTGTASSGYGAISPLAFMTDLNSVNGVTIGPNIVW